MMRILAQRDALRERWVVILGSSMLIKNHLQSIVSGLPNVQILGFVTDMPSLLLSSDVVVSKPGGLIMAEAFAAGRPVALLSKGAGQEVANSEFLLASGGGFLAEDPEAMVNRIHQVLSDEVLLSDLKARAEMLGRPNAALDIARLVYAMMS